MREGNASLVALPGATAACRWSITSTTRPVNGMQRRRDPPDRLASNIDRGDPSRREIAPARTFVFEHEVEALQAAGLGKGADGSEHPGGPSRTATCKENSLRCDDELARHKVLDLLGDLSIDRHRPRRAPDRHPIGPFAQHEARHQQLHRGDARQGGESGRDAPGDRPRHPRDPQPAAAPLPVPADRPRDRARRLQARRGDQERHDQRAVLPGPLAGPADHARRAAVGSHGPAVRGPAAAQAGEHRQARGALEHRQGQAARRRGARRSASHRGRYDPAPQAVAWATSRPAARSPASWSPKRS